MMEIIILAYYLPQYHPIPENDEWWGKGFTEWTNVTKAKPFYKGHQQPKFPADLGYYDLRVPETRDAQAAMAKEYGLSGFCYYHYWFGNGKQMLNRPVDEVLASGKPDFPFCFCWANQSWTGHWFGSDKKMLIKQEYPGDADIEKHFAYLLPFFRDKRYIRIDNKPLFKILDMRSMENAAHYASKLRELAIKNGLEGLYLVAGQAIPEGWEPGNNNFDAATDDSFGRALRGASAEQNNFKNRVLLNRITRWLTGNSAVFKRRNTFSMQQFMKYYSIADTSFIIFPIVLPNWDNTPRSLSKGIVIKECDPVFFRQQLEIAAEFIKKHLMPPVIFIKSWNEWAEGNYMEPDTVTGYGYLNELKKFLNNLS